MDKPSRPRIETITLNGDVDSISQGENGRPETFINGSLVGGFGSAEKLSLKRIEWDGLDGETKEVKADSVDITNCKNCTFKIVGTTNIFLDKCFNCKLLIYAEKPQDPFIRNTCSQIQVEFFTLGEVTELDN